MDVEALALEDEPAPRNPASEADANDETHHSFRMLTRIQPYLRF